MLPVLINPYSHRIPLPMDLWRCLECLRDLRESDVQPVSIMLGEFFDGQVGEPFTEIGFDSGYEDLPEHVSYFCDMECANLFWYRGYPATEPTTPQ